MPVDTILYNARIATNGVPSFAEAVAITDGKINATGSDREIFRLRGPNTRIIDANGRTVIPGLNDSHMHPIRAGLSYNMELRWDGVPGRADAGATVGAGDRRVDRIPVCRAAAANPG